MSAAETEADRVAAFTHDFETAFDLIRKGSIAAEPDIISVSLSAKDYIRSLIEDPDATDAFLAGFAAFTAIADRYRDAEPTPARTTP